MSENGGKQGDVLAGLGYARLFQRIYENSIIDLPNVTARAIVDDFTIVGPPLEVFTAYDRFKTAARNAGVRVNVTKTVVQQPSGEPTATTCWLAAERGLRVVCGNFEYLGGAVGLDDKAMTTWVGEKLLSQTPLKKAIVDPDCPSMLALNLTKVNLLPVPTYLLRAMPFRNCAAPVSALATQHERALMSRQGISTPLSPQANISLTQPGRNGGLGVRSVEVVAPAAKWAAAAAAAMDVHHFVDENAPLPFVLDRNHCHSELIVGGVLSRDSKDPIPDLVVEEQDEKHKPTYFDLPLDPLLIHVHYGGETRLKQLQRSLTAQVEDFVLQAFLDGVLCSQVDTIRLQACQKSKGRWISSCYAYLMRDRHVNIAIRLWLGLDPLPGVHLATCPLCRMDMSNDQWHAFSCVKLRRKAVTTRHDSVGQLLCRYARSNGALARIEPKDEASLVPDGEIILPTTTVLFDVSGVHPAALSYRRSNELRAGASMLTRQTTKNTKYLSYATNLNAKFVPFVLDTYGWLSKPALRLVNEIENQALHPRLPASTRITSTNFLPLLAVDWQRGNANVVYQWSAMIRAAQLRSAALLSAARIVM